MDPRARPLSIETVVFITIFLLIFKLGIVSMDVTNPVTLILLLLALIEFVRILYKFHVLKKEGVDIDEQGYRNVVVDTVSPQMGDTFAKANKARMYVTIGTVIIVTVILVIYYLIK